MLLFHAHKCRHPSEFPRLAKVTTGGVFELLNVKGHPGHGNLVVPRQREGNGNLSTDMNKPNKFSGDKTPPRKLLRVDVECSHFDKTKWRKEKIKHLYPQVLRFQTQCNLDRETVSFDECQEFLSHLCNHWVSETTVRFTCAFIEKFI